MSIDNAKGAVFHVGQYSSGDITNPANDPIVYTERDAHPYSDFGTGDVTITDVTTSGNTTTITGTVETTAFGTQTLTGTLIGNDASDILVHVSFNGQTAYFFLTNTKAAGVNASPNASFAPAVSAAAPPANGQQPGVGNSVSVANQSENVSYSPSAAVCFTKGTAILTSRGKIAVEALVPGDMAITASGARRPIVWIGHRDINCRNRHDLQPVRIAANAFGPSLPMRDLLLSPGHPVLVGADADGEGGYLVPIMCLINGTTVERVAVDEVVYWHIELDEHDILLAEGLPAESYIDLGSRPWFAGAEGALYDPDMALPDMPGRCRPVAIDGPVVEGERRRLDMVFVARLASAAAWPDMQNALLALF